MQLTPRQYQIDPTGGAYVQDTRPLLAAMGAQAAAQLESDKLMQQTIQQGIKGVENFAARRQLAAARAQLSDLSLEDPEYGRKLSELVMDNPLAFTNPNTAPVADFAFKQASKAYTSKMERETAMLEMDQKYRYDRDKIILDARLRQQMAGGSGGRMDEIGKAILGAELSDYKQQTKAIDSEIAAKQEELLTRSGESALAIQAEIGALQQKKQQVESGFGQALGAMREGQAPGAQPDLVIPPALPFPEQGQVPSVSMGSGGGGIPQTGELPTGGGYINEGLFYDEVPPMPADDPVAAEQNLRAGPGTPIATDPLMQAPVPEPVAPAPAPAPAPAADSGIVEREMARRALVASKASLARERSNANVLPQDKRAYVDTIAAADPDVSILQSRADKAKSEYTELDLEYEELTKTGALPAQTENVRKKLAAAQTNMEQAQRAADITRKALASRLMMDPDPDATIQKMYGAQLKLEQERLKKEEAAAVAATDDVVKQPPLDPLAQAFLQRQLQENAGVDKVSQADNKQWTEAKQQGIESLGGVDKLLELTDSVSKEFAGNSIFTVKNALRVRVQDLLGANKKLNETAFEQATERSGPQRVSWQEIVDAIVEDALSAKAKARAAALENPIPLEPKEGLQNPQVKPKK